MIDHPEIDGSIDTYTENRLKEDTSLAFLESRLTSKCALIHILYFALFKIFLIFEAKNEVRNGQYFSSVRQKQ